MATEKKKRPEAVKITTPRAPAVYPKLDFANPDYGTEAYPIEGGAFSVQVRLVKSDPQVAALLAKLEKVMEQAEAEAQEKFSKLPVATRKKIGEIKRQEFYTDVYDEEENETGEIILKFKMKHSGTTDKGKEWKRYPQLIDAKLQKLKKGTAIWGGSIVRVSGGALPYFVAGQGTYGVSLQLEGVQVIELVSAGGRSASDMGFEEEEGYDTSEGFTEEDTSGDDGDSGSSDDDGAPAGSDDF